MNPLRSRRVKRLADVALAATGLALGAPLLVATAAAVRVSLGAPVIFSQERPGLHGKSFTLRKFRTMRQGDASDAERMTRIGSLLRTLSLDELPTLWNVLVGDMSIVGPRPLLTRYLGRYSSEQARRHDVLPGLTGLAQVRGRNALSWSEKLALDVWYVDHWDLMLDAQIMLETVVSVVTRRGISAPGHVTMPEFMGGDDA